MPKRAQKENAKVKGIVHPKMKILSSFTHPQVVHNLYEILCSAEHKGWYLATMLFWGTVDSIVGNQNTMEVNGAPELLSCPYSSQYLPLCSAEQRHSYRFGTTWGWANDKVFISGWTIPLSVSYQGCVTNGGCKAANRFTWNKVTNDTGWSKYSKPLLITNLTR